MNVQVRWIASSVCTTFFVSRSLLNLPRELPRPPRLIISPRSGRKRNFVPAPPPSPRATVRSTRISKTKVTRKRRPDSLALVEVSKYLSALKSKPSDPYFFVTTYDNLSVHIHLGTHTGFHSPNIPLGIFKHLALILITYEDMISLFHHPERRGYQYTKTSNMACSNRFGIQGNAHICGNIPLPSLATITRKIFSCDSLPKLAKLMDDNGITPPWYLSRTGPAANRPRVATRFKFVNWDNLSNSFPQSKHTLEFRQHTGTRDPNAVAHWSRLIVALFRAAERKHHADTPPSSPSARQPSVQELDLEIDMMGQARKYAWPTKEQEDRVRALFDLLELERRDQMYWTWRMGKMEKLEWMQRYSYDICPACPRKPVRKLFPQSVPRF